MDRRGRSAWIIGHLALAGGLGISIWTAPVAAAGPSITVEPAGPLPVSGATITVHGSGFDGEANGGVGIYVVFGPVTTSPTYHTDAAIYGAARWVHRGAGEDPGQAELGADGTFATTLQVTPSYVDGHGQAVDCLVSACAVITMAAHGVPDRTFDTFTPVGFSSDVASATSSVTLPIPGGAAALGVAMSVTVGIAVVLRRRAGPRG